MLTNHSNSAFGQNITLLTNCFGSLNTFMMHLTIPSMLGSFLLMLRRSLIQFVTQALPAKFLNSSFLPHMFNLFYLTFAIEHSPFMLPISTSLADNSMLAYHRGQSKDPGYTKFTFVLFLHIHTLY